jgi:TPR repeat protein/DNA-binding HxlR family transcriptional regulator
MSRIDLPKIYNPATQTREELIENFVVRTALFQDIFQDIKKSEMKYAEQHYIIQGVRGQGKTTLLLRLAYEIQNDTALSKRLIPVIFNEEQYNISRLFKLWETTAEYLDEHGEIQGMYHEMQKLDDDEDFEQRCFDLLEKELKKRGKKLILFIDNIDDMLARFSAREHHRLREIFTESAELRVIGASSVTLEFHYDYGKPFYQFFKMPQLRGLSADETKTLLLKLGERYKSSRVEEIVRAQPGRVESLRRLTGGVIRTIILLFDIFIHDTSGNAFADLSKIFDSVTPLYKHRMDSLPAQQQEIVDFIALSWDAVSTKEIAGKTKLQSKVVSAQLKQLEKYHIIEKVETDNKNLLYRIAERFFNIWYLMRHGRKWDEKRVRFLVEFLQIWCDQQELENRAQRHLHLLQSGKQGAEYMLLVTEALARTCLEREMQHRLLEETKTYLEKKNSDLKAYLSKSDYQLSQEAWTDFEAENYDTAIKHLENIKVKDAREELLLGTIYAMTKIDLHKAEEHLLNAVEKELPQAMYNLAQLYENEFKDFKKAEKLYLMAVEKDDADSMYNLALLYQTELKDFKKAEKFYLMAVEKEDAEAMYYLAWLYQFEFKDPPKAEKYYLMAVEREDARAMNNIAWLYQFEFKDPQKAEKYYLMAVGKGLPQAMNNLALLYHNKLKDLKEAEKFYLMAVEKGYPRAIYNLALLYHNEFKDLKRAEKFYLMAVEKELPQAMNNLAWLNQFKLKDFKKAEKFYLMAVEKEYARAMVNLAVLYHTEFKDLKKAEKFYRMAVEKEDAWAMANLALLYFQKEKNREKALEYAQKAFSSGKNIYTSATYSMILLWNDNIEQAVNVADNFLTDKDSYEKFPEDISLFLLLLMAKKQYHLTLKIFTENLFQLKDRFKPIYYALMYFLQDEYPNEYRKMGAELKETVDEIIAEIRQLEKDYE